MNYEKLRQLKKKLYFTIEDLQELLKIKSDSARVLCSRYTKSGFFVRLKKNFYILTEVWENMDRRDFIMLANLIQVPSYISFMTALSIYEISTQIQRNFFESASLKRSVRTEVKGITFDFHKLKKQYYFDFIKKDSYFIATAEKAFIDAVYLYSFGKYKIDFDSLDLKKLNKNKLSRILKVFPSKTQKIIKKLCRI